MSFDRIGIIGGGAWGTALAQVAAAGGRETLLWAMRGRGGRGDQRAPRKSALPCRRPARSGDPRNDATSPISTTAMPGWWSRRRSTCARCLSRRRGATCRWCSAPRASRSAAASCCTRSRARLRPDAPVAVLSARPSRMRWRRACRPRSRSRPRTWRSPSSCASGSPADLPHLRVRRRRRRGDRRRGQERARDRLRRGRGQGPRPECARGADRPRLRRNDPLRPRLRRASARRWPACPASAISSSPALRPARAIIRSARASAKAARPPSCSPTAARSPKARSPRRCSPGWRATRASTCRSSMRSMR